MTMRCFWPPGELVGVAPGRVPAGMPTSSRAAAIRRPRSAGRHAEVGQALAHAGADAHLGVQRAVGVLEHDLHVAGAARAGRRGSSPQIRVPSKSTSPEVGGSRYRSARARVVLPQPDSPTRPKVLPALDREAHPVDGLSTAATGRCRPPRPVALREIADLDHPTMAVPRSDTARRVPGSCSQARGHLRAAPLLGQRAAGVEGAARGNRLRVRHRAGDRRQARAALWAARDRGEQQAGVRVQGLAEDRSRLPSRRPARVDHRHPVGDGAHDGAGRAR